MSPWVIRDRVEPAASSAMSASHPKRPSVMKMRFVAKGQQRTHTPRQKTASFDHLIGACQQRRGHREAERFGGLEIVGSFTTKL